MQSHQFFELLTEYFTLGVVAYIVQHRRPGSSYTNCYICISTLVPMPPPFIFFALWFVQELMNHHMVLISSWFVFNVINGSEVEERQKQGTFIM